MSFLKSCVAAIFIVTLHACTNKVTQAYGQEPATAAMPASVKETVIKTLPSFTMLDAAGNKLDLQQFKGKKVFVNLWATWCPPCRAELPSIEKLYRGLDTANVQFVLLSLDNKFETAKEFVQKKGYTLPVFFPAGDIPELFAVDGIPTTFIFNKSGELIAQREGAEEYNTRQYHNLFSGSK